MLHQLVQYRLPRQIAAGDGGGSQAVDVPCQDLGAQSGRGGLCILAVEQQIITHPDADNLVRVLGFQVQVFLYIGGQARFLGFFRLGRTHTGIL